MRISQDDSQLEEYLKNLLFDDEGIETFTSEDQIKVEESIIPLLESAWLKPTDTSEGHPTEDTVKLERRSHINFISTALNGLPQGYVSLDASKPWILYWTLHALNLLGIELSLELKNRAVRTLRQCLDEEAGAFGGGKGQLPHLATTYAAVNSIAILEMEEAYAMLDPKKIYAFFLSLKQSDGSFTMHHNGEIDVR